jgi:cytochrome P450/nitrite reductase/ring-hydroxylating ferredoxin subunit
MNASLQAMQPRSPDTVVIARTKELEDSRVKAVNIDGIDLIVLRHANAISIFQGRCPHEGTLLSEGTIKDGLLTCRAHDWQFNCSSGCKQGLGVSNLKRFEAIVEDGDVKVDRNEVRAWNAKRSAPDHKTPLRASPVRSLSQLPGPKRIPFRGTALHLQPDRLHLVLEQWSREFGPVYTFRLIGRPFVAIADPILIHQVLRDRPGAYRRWNTIETVARELGINGVFSTEGDAWRRQRQLVAKALDPLHLRALFPSLCEMTRRLLQRWESATLAQQAIDIQKDLMRYTLDVTTNLALGYDMGTIDGQGQGDVIQRHLEVMFPAINRRISAPFPVWRDTRRPADKALDRALIAVQALTKELIAANRARLAQRSAADTIPANLLEALLMAQQEGEAPLTDDEVLANVFTILLAGQDTTASTIAWVAYFMASHPEVQRKMQEEVDAVIAPAAMLEDFDAGDALLYLNAVINETMRLKSVTPVLAVEPNYDVQVGDIAIPKGAVLSLLTREAGLQQGGNSAVDVFDPDRWLTGASAASHHRAGFMPFGSGPRLCPGRSLALMEVRSAVAMLCRNFDLLQVKDAPEVEEVFAFSMVPRNLRVELRRRG